MEQQNKQEQQKQKKKYKFFVTSDVHSFFRPFKQALEAAGFDETDPTHYLIICGDLFDRGPDTVRLYHYIKSLQDRAILIYGNHELLLESLVTRGYYFYNDITNGTADTETQFLASFITMDEVMSWMKSKYVWYAETDSYIFVHSWVPIDPFTQLLYQDWRKAPDGLWKEATWGNPFEDAKNPKVFPNEGKKIVFGHWGTYWKWGEVLEGVPEDRPFSLSKFDMYEDENIVALDACTALSGRCNVFVFEDTKLPKLGRKRK